MADRPSSSDVQDAEADAVLRLTLAELCHECRAESAHVTALVDEGVLEPECVFQRSWTPISV
jgi:hypothetical protein